ncbi:hypothetical protein GCM10012290_25880 [Halolactibacillus alkaliphilus]|uniref:HD domain-containing protein n=1 Tax=Halolactibacillus alkaliphilus TaxID=442899 RepID=A0A511X518_9BACI|nr:hypothetical protein [Halolactibacillus alkaliphilus]GEN58057.1 hypothetical protein HAL01_25210 [Halolactibacillus alkaliphilus]GGN76292.1 hypothetical protein GCM10012290_25880 [Halolactibacillus alkaliphilus]
MESRRSGKVSIAFTTLNIVAKAIYRADLPDGLALTIEWLLHDLSEEVFFLMMELIEKTRKKDFNDILYADWYRWLAR